MSISWTRGIRMRREWCVDTLQNNKLYYMEENIMTTQEIIEVIKGLSVLELNDLVKAC